MTLVVAMFKIFVGLLLAITLAFIVYFVSTALVISVLRPSTLNGVLITVLTVGLGAGVGAFMGWFEGGRSVLTLLAIFAVTMAFAFAGSYVGILQGIERAPFQPSWQYGLPVLSYTVGGGVIGANLLPLALWLFDTARNSKVWLRHVGQSQVR